MTNATSIIETSQKTEHDPFVQFVELLAKINNREQIIQRSDEQDENPEETTHN